MEPLAFDFPSIGLRYFVALAPEDRSTLENWMRSGALVPSGSGDESGTKMFSMADVLKVEVMHRLRLHLGMSPSLASTFADRIVEDYRPHASFDFVHIFYPDSGAEKSNFRPVYYFESAEGGLVEAKGSVPADASLVILPVSHLARIAISKTKTYLDYIETALPPLREQVRKALEAAKAREIADKAEGGS